jgi:hypothetical protein
MSGTQRLPGGERRKASQRHSRPAAPLQPVISRLWHPGDRVRWRDRIGVFRRDVGDSEHAEKYALALFSWIELMRSIGNS